MTNNNIMKKIILIIAAVFVALIAVIPAFATNPTTECQHLHTFEPEATCCPDCGAEVYKCEECGTVFYVDEQECPICKTERPPLTQEEKINDYIHNKKSEFISFVVSAAAGFVITIVIIIYGVKVSPGAFCFEVIVAPFLLVGIIGIIITYPIVAPYM